MPTRLMQRAKLGRPAAHGTAQAGESVAAGKAPRFFVKVGDFLSALFEFHEPLRILSSDVLKKIIAKGASDGQFTWFNRRTP
jgi:hypothetical protein